MIDFKKNNLDRATSPYLQQHKDNPIHWQEWSPEVLDHAKKHDKILFVSIGYATCHWCHVMAQESFSSNEIADLLNRHFVCIKVDREQRPDIDHYLMNFCQETQGQGGWPLNVFLTSDQKPFLAVTYVPITSRYGMPGLLDLLQHVKQSYSQHAHKIPVYALHIRPQEDIAEQDMIAEIKARFTGAGFHHGPQFPPHNTLLFLLSWYEQHHDGEIKDILEKTLEVMARGGLHDHVQGGFYRYCVDGSWTIPHFEKMLYDQAMLLWVYSLAYKIFKKTAYKTVAEKIMTCLEDSYEDKLYYAAHDADTDHDEGTTYLWDTRELQHILSDEEYARFKQLYLLEENFEGKIHLTKRSNSFLPEVEQKLLRIRKKRAQPFTDKKVITSWNALLGIAFIVSSRCLDSSRAKAKGVLLFKNILREHYHEGLLSHSSYEGKLQPGEFLEDYAAMLLFATYLYEETGEYKDLLETWTNRVRLFKPDHWIESKTNDFRLIPAKSDDHPTPSSVSLAEMALLRSSLFRGKTCLPVQYRQPLQYDFFNLVAFISLGNWHCIHIPDNIKWEHLPANCMQIHDSKIQDCYNGSCVECKDVTDLLGGVQKYQRKG